MKKTPFRIAAERFAEKTELNENAACLELCSIVTGSWYNECIECDFFVYRFRPSNDEYNEYECDGRCWLTSKNTHEDQNRQDRILALLFCEQLWLDEQKRNP